MCGRLSRPPDVLVKIEEARLRVRTSSEFIRIAVREWNDSTLGFGPGSAAQSPFMEGAKHSLLVEWTYMILRPAAILLKVSYNWRRHYIRWRSYHLASFIGTDSQVMSPAQLA